jgi:hypothetical protein
MRKTLLIAAAALAAGVISSQAGVYSQNIVGYVNYPMTQASANYFVSVPFQIGQTNGANEVFGTTLPPGTQIDTWNGSGFTVNIFDNDPNGIGDTIHHWFMFDGGTITNPPVLPVGLGFLMVPNGTVTNTFAGAIAIPVGTSNQMVFTNISANYFVGEAVPYAGALTNGNSSTGGANFNLLPPGSQVDFWNGNGFTVYIYDNDPNGIGDTIHHWFMFDGGTITNTPTIVPGESFLFIPNGDYTWTTGL